MVNEELSQPTELYGRFVEVLKISTEAKNLQYLTNELFKAAQLDIQLDVKQQSSNNKENFNLFIDNYLTKLGVDEESKERTKGALENSLEPLYVNLKDKLQKVRIFNVGKSGFGKVKTAVGNLAKAFTPVVTAACVVGAAALTYFSFKEGMEAWSSLFKGDAMGYFINSTVSNIAADGAKGMAISGALATHFGLKRSVELFSIRSEMKNILSNAAKSVSKRDVLKSQSLKSKTSVGRG